MNDCVEAFFDSEINWPFEEIHKAGGVPTAEISTQFKAPSRHGDHLNLSLEIRRVGRSSLKYTITAVCADELRFKTECTLVNVGKDGRSAPWAKPIHGKLKQFMEGRI